jgi:hypothetical protein
MPSHWLIVAGSLTNVLQGAQPTYRHAKKTYAKETASHKTAESDASAMITAHPIPLSAAGRRNAARINCSNRGGSLQQTLTFEVPDFPSNGDLTAKMMVDKLSK